jgi:NNP family nitrate/nitrite transporter-like MFS transporter
MLTIAAATTLWLIQCGLVVLGFAAGFYLPSAIATITSLVDKRHWGKAIAIHELAPNLAFFCDSLSRRDFSSVGQIGAEAWECSARYRSWRA